MDWESKAAKSFYPTKSAVLEKKQWVFVLKPGCPWVSVPTVSQLHNSVFHPHHLALSVTKPITVKHVSSAPMPSTSLLTEIPSCASGVSVGLTDFCGSWQKVTLQWRRGKINPENVKNSYDRLVFFLLLRFCKFVFTLKTKQSLLFSSPVWFCDVHTVDATCVTMKQFALILSVDANSLLESCEKRGSRIKYVELLL